MDINQLRDEIVKVVKERYPNEWGLEDRYISLVRQVGGFGESLQFVLVKFQNPTNTIQCNIRLLVLW